MMHRSLLLVALATSVSVSAMTTLLSAPARASEALAPVVVSANRIETPLAEVGSAVEVLEGESLTRLGVSNVAEALEYVTGFASVRSGGPGGQTSVFVRGFNQGYIKVLVDGIDVADASIVQPATEFSNLLLADVERIELLKGSQSLVYGGQAVAGVVSITTRRPKGKTQSHHLAGEVGSYGTANGSYGTVIGTDKGFVTLNMQSGRTSGFSAADERNGNTERDGTEYFGFGVNGGFDLTEKLSLEGGLRVFQRETEYDGFGFTGPIDSADIARTADVQMRMALKHEDGPLSQTLSLSNTHADRSYRGGFDSDYNSNRTRLDYLANYRLSKMVELTGGVEANFDATKVDTGTPVNTDSQLYAAFAQVALKPLAGLTLTGGVRADHHSEFGTYPTGRLTAAYVPVAGTKLRASAGTGFRAPSHYELFDPSWGNDQLEPEKSRSFDAGIEQSLMGGRVVASLGVFHTKLDNAIDWVWPTGYAQVPGESIRKGIEASLAAKLTPSTGLTLAYTLTDAERRDGSRVPRVPEHSLSARLHADLTDKLALDLNARYVREFYDTEFVGFTTIEMDPYLLVNAQLSYALTDSATIYLRGENLLDEEYQTVWGFGTAGRSAYVGVRARF